MIVGIGDVTLHEADSKKVDWTKTLEAEIERVDAMLERTKKPSPPRAGGDGSDGSGDGEAGETTPPHPRARLSSFAQRSNPVREDWADYFLLSVARAKCAKALTSRSEGSK